MGITLPQNIAASSANVRKHNLVKLGVCAIVKDRIAAVAPLQIAFKPSSQKLKNHEKAFLLTCLYKPYYKEFIFNLKAYIAYICCYPPLAKLIIVEMPHQRSGIAIRTPIQLDKSLKSTIRKLLRPITLAPVTAKL